MNFHQLCITSDDCEALACEFRCAIAWLNFYVYALPVKDIIFLHSSNDNLFFFLFLKISLLAVFACWLVHYFTISISYLFDCLIIMYPLSTRSRQALCHYWWPLPVMTLFFFGNRIIITASSCL